MKLLNHLFDNNKLWADSVESSHPGFFKKLFKIVRVNTNIKKIFIFILIQKLHKIKYNKWLKNKIHSLNFKGIFIHTFFKMSLT